MYRNHARGRTTPSGSWTRIENRGRNPGFLADFDPVVWCRLRGRRSLAECNKCRDPAIRFVAGPVVVPLAPPTGGFSSGCVEDVDRSLIKAIRSDPAGYYVNVHNADFPAGAVRGQLSK